MSETREWYAKSETEQVFGPVDFATLVHWAEDGRIEPTSTVSSDARTWTPAPYVEQLGMVWIVEARLGQLYGPFNRAVVDRLIAEKSVPADVRLYRLQTAADAVAPAANTTAAEESDGEPPVQNALVGRVRSADIFAEESAVVKTEERPPTSFGNTDRDRLAALEQAAQRELARGRSFGFGKRLFGRK